MEVWQELSSLHRPQRRRWPFDLHPPSDSRSTSVPLRLAFDALSLSLSLSLSVQRGRSRQTAWRPARPPAQGASIYVVCREGSRNAENCGQTVYILRTEREVKKSQKYVDVICGSPLTPLLGVWGNGGGIAARSGNISSINEEGNERPERERERERERGGSNESPFPFLLFSLLVSG